MKLYALLVGINDYPTQPLSQCVNDVERIDNYLIGLSDHFDEIKTLPLTDAVANKKGIEKGISKFLAQATDEDVALFYYSGHGAYEKADGRFPSEQDGKLECLVAHHTAEATSGFLLANKEIRYLLSKMPHNPHLITIFDCCHSGNIVRSIDEADESLVLKRMAYEFPARPPEEFIFQKEIPLKSFQNQTVEKLIPAKNSIHISACTSSQSSWENPDGGIFTSYLLDLLKVTHDHLTYQEITRWAKVGLRNMTTTQQTPTISIQGTGGLNGFASWLNLPIEKTQQSKEKLVMHTQAKGWQLLQGKVMGLESGTELEIDLGNGKSILSKTDVVGFDSAKLVFPNNDQNLLDTNNKYAVSLKTVATQLKIFINDLDFDAATKTMVEEMIAALEKVELVEKAAANYWVNIFNQMVYLTLPNDDFRPLAKQIDLLVEIETEEAMQIRVAAELRHQLKYLADWHFLDTLENLDRGFDTPPIRVELRAKGSDEWTDITNIDHHLTCEKERLQGLLYKKHQVKITNQTQEKLYVGALMMNNDMEISTAPFGNQVIELDAGTSKLFYDHFDDTWGIAAIDDYKEFYNWKAEFFHYKFIINNFENFSDVFSKFPQLKLENPITTLKKGGFEPMIGRGARMPSNPRKWGTLKSTVWLDNPFYNVPHGILANHWDAFKNDEQLAPFIEHLYFENIETGVVFTKDLKPSAMGIEKSRNINGIKKGIGNFLSDWHRKRLFKRARRRFPNKPVVVAEGDSWFLYPLLVKDTIDYVMEEFPVRSLAAAGDELQNYRFSGDLTQEIRKLKPDFVLISGGGNDVIGPGIKDLLLEDALPGGDAKTYLNLEKHKLKMEQLVDHYRFFFRVIGQMPSVKHTFVHGYDYVRTDHREDWVKKGWVNRYLLDFKINDAADRQRIINYLVDYFNTLLENLVKDFDKVSYLKMLGEVQQEEWFDEIHPNDVGFEKVGRKFIEAIREKWEE